MTKENFNAEDAYALWKQKGFQELKCFAKENKLNYGTISIYSSQFKWRDRKREFLREKTGIVQNDNLSVEIEKLRAFSWQKLKEMAYSEQAGDVLNAISLILAYSQPKPGQTTQKTEEKAPDILENLEKRLKET